MIANWNISEFTKDLEERKVEDALNVIGSQCVSWASDNLRKNKSVVSSHLVNNISYATDKTQSNPAFGEAIKAGEKLSVRFGSNLVYAAIQEFGGKIKAVNAKELTIPVHPDAKKLIANGGTARDMDLVYIVSKKGNHLLVRMKKDKTFDVMFVLKDKVEIPAKSYLRPAMESHKKEIVSILQKAING